jgi:DNA-binding NarL/FixJ family response regulator
MYRTAIDLGGKGYLLKDSPLQEIVIAVQAVMAGRMYLSPAIAMQLLHAELTLSKPPEKSLIADLTPSERRILQLIGDRMSSRK